MKIIPIFGGESEAHECDLWAVCYPEHGSGAPNIFRKLFNLWNDSEYLLKFFSTKQDQLARPLWKGMSPDEAVDQILDEAHDFEAELKGIEMKMIGYENTPLTKVFEYLHTNEFIFRGRNDEHRKARPDTNNPMLRIYAVILEDGCYVITGGGIKLTDSMKEAELESEVDKIKRVQDYLKREGITSREGLIQSL